MNTGTRVYEMRSRADAAAATGERILDACAAPGGKTCHILERVGGPCHVTALDVSAARLDRVHENLARLGLSADVRAGDLAAPSDWWDGQAYDRILLDVPGGTFWKTWMSFVDHELRARGYISPGDVDLVTITDDPEVALGDAVLPPEDLPAVGRGMLDRSSRGKLHNPARPW